MAQYGRGAKAGLLAGLIEGIIAGVILYAVSQSFKSVIQTSIQNALPAGSTIDVAALTNFVLLLIPIATIIGGLIGGLILGLIFAAVQDKYMKSQSLPIRGLVFGLILFVIDLVLNSSSFRYGMAYTGSNILISLVSSLIFGYLLGFFFKRFGPNIPAEPSTVSPPPPPPPPTAM